MSVLQTPCLLSAKKTPIAPAIRSSPSHRPHQEVSRDVQVCVCSTFQWRTVAVTAGESAVGGEQATRASLRKWHQISTASSVCARSRRDARPNQDCHDLLVARQMRRARLRIFYVTRYRPCPSRADLLASMVVAMLASVRLRTSRFKMHWD